MTPKHRILFKGYYNLHNFGDDLLLLAILDFFQNQMQWGREEVKLFVEPEEKSIQKLGYPHPYRLLPYLDPVKAKHARLKHSGQSSRLIKGMMGLYMLGCLLSALIYRVTNLQLGNRKNIRFFRTLDVIHYIGGGYLNTRLTWGTQFLVYELFFLAMARLINPKIQVIGTGLGIGPVHTQLYKRLFKRFIQNFSYLFVREKESETFIRSLGYQGHVQCIGDDVALLLPYFQDAIKETKPKAQFGLNLKFDTVHQYGDVQHFFERLLQERKAHGEEVIFFNFGRDHMALRQLPRELVNTISIQSCYETGLRHFAQRMAESKKSLGFAYHFAILCTLMKIPSANIYFDDYYRQKTGGVLELLCDRHLTLPYHQLGKLTPEKLLNELNQVDQAHATAMFEQLRQNYRQAYEDLERRRKESRIP